MRTPEIPEDVFLGVASFLRSDHHDRLSVQLGKTAHNRRVVGKSPVSVKFQKIGEYAFDIVKSVRTVRVTRQLNSLPGREIRINGGLGFVNPLFQRFEFFRDFRIAAQGFFQFGLPRSHLFDRFFKIQNDFRHSNVSANSVIQFTIHPSFDIFQSQCKKNA